MTRRRATGGRGGEPPAGAAGAASRRQRRAGRPRGPRAEARRRTEERLLEGALRAIARHGVAKLGMGDVSAHAQVSKGTAYRYFRDTDEVLRALGRREAERFERQVWEALERAPRDEARLALALDYVERLGREHPLIRRLPETDPGLVLTSLRERFPDIRAAFQRLLGPLLEETDLVRSGEVSADRLAGWTARIMISLFLFPEPEPSGVTADLRAAYRLVAGRPPGAKRERLPGRAPREDSKPDA
jgi:AcrR family transcriptional regulator